MPSLKPIRLRGVAWRAARRSTCGRSRAATSAAPPRRGRAGPGCARRGRRPAGRPRRPGRTGRRRSGRGRAASPGNGGERRPARPGAGAASPKRSSNSDGPKPIVTVSRAGGRPSASPVSSGGAAATRPPVADRLARPSSAPPPPSTSRAVAAAPPGRRRRQVERREGQPVLRRRSRCRPGARRGTGRPSARSGRRGAGPVLAPCASPDRVPAAPPTAAERRRRRARRGPRRAEPRARRRPGDRCSPSAAVGPLTMRPRQLTTSLPATCESGSASASTACASARTWSCGQRGVRARTPSPARCCVEQRPAPSANRSVDRCCASVGVASRSSAGCEQLERLLRRRRRWPGSRAGRCASSAPPRR